MSDAITHDGREQLLLARDCRLDSDRMALAAKAARGELVRVVRGVYVRPEAWTSLPDVERYRLRIHAVAATSRSALTFSRESAAALWGLPWFGPWPTRVHALDATAPRGRSTTLVTRHALGRSADSVEVEGLHVTSLARTVLDIAGLPDLTRAVVVADAALAGRGSLIAAHRVVHAELASMARGLSHSEGSARARDAIRLADGRSGSPGESISRVSMERAGLPRPVLQQRFEAPGGGSWFTDFWWPEANLIGEFDGRGKYLNEELRDGRTPGEVVYDEKVREDGLRGRGHRVTRWGYETAVTPRLLAAHLRHAGLAPARRRGGFSV